MPDLTTLVAAPGPNDLVWTDPAFPAQPLTLRSARPRRFTAETPVLFVHHGTRRNGGDDRDHWLKLVDEADLLVVVPEFSAESFPGPAWYDFGNVKDANGNDHPRTHWTYGIVERLFADLRARGVTQRRMFGLFGHSAGGQFVHRMVSLGFRSCVAAAVTANAGSYAMPDFDVPFPYGLGGTGLDRSALRDLLGFRLTVMVGTSDTGTHDGSFPREAAAMLQGRNRHARALRCMETARAEAAAFATHCAWALIDVKGVGHDGARMSQAAAPLLSAALHGSERLPTTP